jgi:hypothetical protein
MANDCSVAQLKSSREDEFAMLVIACPFGWPFPYVRATPHRQQSAVSSHPPELAIVEALITEGPGQQDVIHVPSSPWGATPQEPSFTTSVDNFSKIITLWTAVEGALRVTLPHVAVVGANASTGN